VKINGHVKLANLHPAMVVACMVIEPIATAYGQELVVTSAADGTHSHRNSKHHIGCALDFRTWFVIDKAAFEAEIQEALTDEFYVVVEPTHLHVQYNGSVM